MDEPGESVAPNGKNLESGPVPKTFDIAEILLILIIALVVIGPEQLPGLLQTAGKILRELRSASNEVMRELSENLDAEAVRPVAPVMKPRPLDQPGEPPTKA